MAPLSDVDVVILAGGRGTRLAPLHPNLQKVVAPVGDRPFLAYLLDRVAQAGACRVVLALGHRGTDVLQSLAVEKWPELMLIPSIEPRPLGTGGATVLAARNCEMGRILVMNGDSYAPIDLSAFVAQHDAAGAEVSLALTHQPDTRRFGSVETDDRGHVLTFQEKGTEQRAGWINAGVYLFQASLLKDIEFGTLSLERDIFPRFRRRGLYGFKFHVPFIDIGTPHTCTQAQKFLAEHSRTSRHQKSA